MSQPYPEHEQRLVASIVQQAGFRTLTQLPILAWQQVGLIAGVYLTVIGGGYAFLQGWLPYPVVLLTSGLAIYAAFTPLHDATHRSVSRWPWLNDLLGTLSAQLLIPGATTQVYRFLHLEHHRHTGAPDKDPDEIMVSSPWPWRFPLMMFIDLVWLSWYLRHMDTLSIRQRLADGISLLVFFGWQLGWLLSPYAWEFVLLWMLPQRLGVLTTAYLFASIQHPEGVEEYQQPLQATRMFKGGWFNRIFMISQSQHLMHHLFPMVPYYRYHQAWLLSEPVLQDQGLIWDWPVGERKMPPPKTTLPNKQLIDVIIIAVQDVSAEVRAYHFKAADGQALPAFKPGAHIDVHIGQDANGLALIRQYSLTGLADAGQYAIAVKREAEGRGGSKQLHANFEVGQQLKISQPRNLFSLQPTDQRAVLVAGGIGITPLLAMAAELHTQGITFDFHICARSTAALPFAEQLKSMPWAQACQYWLADNPLPVSALPGYADKQSLYLCGPAGFMQHVRNIAQQQGWPANAIHSEAFVAATNNDTSNNQAFTVELARSGKTIEVAADQSLLDALQAEQISIAASCVQGLCGTCSCKVLKGEVDHRDQFFNADEHAAGLMTACVSRAAGEKLLIDL